MPFNFSNTYFFRSVRMLVVIISMIIPTLSAHALSYAPQSVLSSGKWVKINVKEEGMQILTPTALKGMGFSDPSKVRVYGYGGHILPMTLDERNPDDLPQQPVVRLADGSIVFYGAGLVKWESESSDFGFRHLNNYYSTIAPYFLSDRDNTDIDPTPITTPIATGAKEIKSFPQLLIHEQDIYTPAITGADLFGEDFRTTPQRTFSFPVIDPAGSSINFYSFFGDNNSTGKSTVAFTSGGKNIGTARQAASGSAYLRVTRTLSSAPIADKPSVDLTLKYSGTATLARLDFIEACYERRLKLSGGMLQFRHKGSGSRVLCIEGCSSSTLIWDVTDPAAPRPVAFELSGSTARFAPADTELHTYVAFNPQSVTNAPAAIGAVKTQDIHSMVVPDLVIIVPSSFRTQAERVAEYHRTHDKLTVHVLDPEDIYNEFSSGKPDVTAYRRMLKMFYDRGNAAGSGTRLQNCLLFGRPSYDHRLITETPKSAKYQRLLTWENDLMSLNVRSYSSSTDYDGLVLTETNSYCSDTYIGMLETTSTFSMSTATMSIGIGRMPVKSALEAKNSVDKLLGYMQNPEYGAWRSRVMIIADDADNAQHLKQAQKMYNNMRAEESAGRDFSFERLYLDSYPIGTDGATKSFPQAKERMFKMLNDGVSMLAYIGHANPTSWTAENLMTYTDLTSLTYKHLPVIYHASCEFVRFDSDSESGAETMWLNPNSGAIAFIAANRKVYIHLNEDMNAAFGLHYFAREADGSPITLGEVLRRTVNSCSNETNKHRFALMGDPAMRVPSPTGSVKIDTFAGVDLDKAVEANDLPVVPAQSTLKVKGRILLANGEANTAFNGTICATLFDAERVIETYGHPSESGKGDGKVSIYNDHKNRLAIASFPVKNGEWEATLFLPEEIDDNYTPALLSLYAYTPEGAEAIGSTESFYVYGFDDSLATDDVPPVIEMAALGSAMFRPGDMVAPSTTFLAKVKDESGINISSAGIGKALTIMIDGRKIYDDVSDYFVTDPNDPTAGSIEYPLDNLSEGSHELVFQVFDNAGNCSKATLPFKVGSEGYLPQVDLRTDASPASVEANFYVTTARQPSEAVVEVFDLSGRCVWRATPETLSQSMNVKWNLCYSNTPQRVPRGIYLYSATVTYSDGTRHRKTRKLAVTEK